MILSKLLKQSCCGPSLTGTGLANLSDSLGAVHMICSHVMLMIKVTADQFKFPMSASA